MNATNLLALPALEALYARSAITLRMLAAGQAFREDRRAARAYLDRGRQARARQDGERGFSMAACARARFRLACVALGFRRQRVALLLCAEPGDAEHAAALAVEPGLARKALGGLVRFYDLPGDGNAARDAA